MQQGSETLNFDQVVSVLRRRVPLIALCVVVVAVAAYGFSKHETKKYTASASLVFNTNQLSQQIVGLPTSNTGNLVAQHASNLELVRLGDMSAKTASQLGHGLTEAQVSQNLSIAAEGESSVVDVSATAHSPVLAAAIANTYVRVFVAEQQRANSQYFKSALALVHRQLAKLSPQQRVGSDGLALQNRAQALGLLSELQSGNVQVAQLASVPTSASSPKTSTNTLLGGFIGLLIGLGLAFLLERLDRRIRGSEDLEEIYSLPLIGAIPESSALARSAAEKGGKRTALPPTEAEAFNLIRAHLRFFNVDRELRTVLIASAGVDDGKTTVAWRLAEAAASVGSRVLLMEVDLRRPTLDRRLDVQAGPGLTDVLIGALPMHEAIQSIVLDSSADTRVTGRTLDVLVAGAMRPPNPGELTESHAMEALLEQAKSTYDLVVIDAPPLTAVSDAFPLLSKVDGVVIVGRIGHSRRDLAEGLHRILESSSAPLLGVIANGLKAGIPGSQAYTAGRGSSSSSSPSLAPTPPKHAPAAQEPAPPVKV